MICRVGPVDSKILYDSTAGPPNSARERGAAKRHSEEATVTVLPRPQPHLTAAVPVGVLRRRLQPTNAALALEKPLPARLHPVRQRGHSSQSRHYDSPLGDECGRWQQPCHVLAGCVLLWWVKEDRGHSERSGRREGGSERSSRSPFFRGHAKSKPSNIHTFRKGSQFPVRDPDHTTLHHNLTTTTGLLQLSS